MDKITGENTGGRIKKFQPICPQCGLDRMAAIGELAKGYEIIAFLLWGCPDCKQVLVAWEKSGRDKEAILSKQAGLASQAAQEDEKAHIQNEKDREQARETQK